MYDSSKDFLMWHWGKERSQNSSISVTHFLRNSNDSFPKAKAYTECLAIHSMKYNVIAVIITNNFFISPVHSQINLTHFLLWKWWPTHEWTSSLDKKIHDLGWTQPMLCLLIIVIQFYFIHYEWWCLLWWHAVWHIPLSVWTVEMQHLHFKLIFSSKCGCLP